MPSLSKHLEDSLRRALNYAAERHHEFATLEHMLLSLLDDPDALSVLRACDVANVDARAGLLAELARCDPPLRAVFHSAGSVRDRLLGELIEMLRAYADIHFDLGEFAIAERLTRQAVVKELGRWSRKRPADAERIAGVERALEGATLDQARTNLDGVRAAFARLPGAEPERLAAMDEARLFHYEAARDALELAAARAREQASLVLVGSSELIV